MAKDPNENQAAEKIEPQFADAPGTAGDAVEPAQAVDLHAVRGVEDTLQRIRADLLDLTSRSPLLNFKVDSKITKRSVRLSGVTLSALQEFIEEGSSFSFVPLPQHRAFELDRFSCGSSISIEDWARLLGVSANYDLSRPDQPAEYADKLEKLRSVLLSFKEIADSQKKPVSLVDYLKDRDIDPQASAKLLRHYGMKDCQAFLERLSEDPDYLPEKPAASVLKEGQFRMLALRRECDAILRNIYNDAKTTEEEMGMGTLFLAVGFLEWYENELPDRPLLAPIFSIPLRIERGKSAESDSAYEYVFTPDPDNLCMNLSLATRLDREHQFALPEMEEEEDWTIYLDRVEKSVERFPKWKVRRFASVGQLNFSKQIMYQDLQTSSWPNGADDFLTNPIVSRLFVTTKNNSGTYFNEDYDIDAIPENQRLVLTQNADASQHSALIDALVKNKSLIIEGPPGTGKSQTITNLIAAALAKGKKVLFVAEKMAALEVVKRKLEASSLSPFCLDLGGSNPSRKSVIDSLDSRIKLGAGFKGNQDYDFVLKSYNEQRDFLNGYANLVNSKWKGTNLTVNEIFASRVHYRSKLKSKDISPVQLPFEGEVFSPEFREKVETLSNIVSSALASLEEEGRTGDIRELAWYSVGNSALNNDDAVSGVIELLRQWQDSLRKQNTLFNAFQKKWSITAGDKQEDAVSFESSWRALLPIEAPQFLKDVNHLIRKSDLATGNMILSVAQSLMGKFENLSKCVNREPLKRLSQGEKIKAPDLVKLGLEGDGKVTLARLQEKFNLLVKLNNEIENIEALFSELRESLPPALAEQVQSSYEGYDFVIKFLKVVNAAPLGLLGHRNKELEAFNVGERQILLEEYLKELNEEKAALGETFDLDAMVRHPDLKGLYGKLKDKPFLSLFNSDYRKAKSEFSSFVRDRRQPVEELVGKIPAVDEFARDLKAFEDEDFGRTFGTLFEGLGTETEKIRRLRAWYAAARETYGMGFGSNAKIGDLILGLDAGLIEKIQKLPSSLIGSMEQVSALLHDVEEYMPALRNSTSINWMENYQLKNTIAAVREDLVGLLGFYRNLNLCAADLQKIDELIHDARQDYKILDSQLSRMGYQESVSDLLMDGTQDAKWERFQQNFVYLINIHRGVSNRNLKEGILRLDRGSQFEDLKSDLLRIYHEDGVGRNFKKKFLQEIQSTSNAWFASLKGYPSLQKMIDRNDKALRRPNQLIVWSNFLYQKDQLRSLGFDALCSLLLNNGISPKLFTDHLNFSIYSLLSQEILAAHPQLSQLGAASLEAAQKNLAKWAGNLVQSARETVKARLLENPVPAGERGRLIGSFTESALIERLIEKPKTRLSLRKLVERSANALLALKPCWMMSPQTVAQFLQPGKIKFDLVLMDEASQIRPADAIGALMRANQAVIVGDSKQLPPTTFFQRNDIDETTSEDEQYSLSGNESVLESMSAFLPKRILNWHYRSQHESLISFSNERFYNRELIVFPSPTVPTDDLGLRFTYVENGIFADGVNRQEACAVVDAVVEHARTSPTESLAVVTMNARQQQLIEAMLEERMVEDKEVRDLVSVLLSLKDPLIIKNLENIQGDERDIVFISCTYGRKVKGEPIVRNFGPISKELGWRRLNVLFTRARKRSHVFSSMHGYEISMDGLTSSLKSLATFRGYLERAERFVSRTSRQIVEYPQTPFEEDLVERLSFFGFKCNCRVGVAGYFIDVAVVDPNDEFSYLMGIECDGASYASAKSAQDRDCLREEVLRKLGWKLRRIWSPDWYSNSDGVIISIVDELRQLSEESKERNKDRHGVQQSLLEIEEFKFDLPSRLQELSLEIQKQFPKTPFQKRLLRKEMRELLIETNPTTMEEYRKYIPEYVRAQTDNREVDQYLPQILNVIAAFS